MTIKWFRLGPRQLWAGRNVDGRCELTYDMPEHLGIHSEQGAESAALCNRSGTCLFGFIKKSRLKCTARLCRTGCFCVTKMK